MAWLFAKYKGNFGLQHNRVTGGLGAFGIIIIFPGVSIQNTMSISLCNGIGSLPLSTLFTSLWIYNRNLVWEAGILAVRA
jgi:hypothetical protein